MNAVYEAGIILKKLGVLFAGDMTLEATITKMAFLLGMEITIEERNKLYI